MANQQIQFQPGMSIPELLRCFGTEAQCAEAVKAARWPGGFPLSALRPGRSLCRLSW